MQQILVEIPMPWGKLAIHGYGVMVALACWLGTWLAAKRMAKQGGNPELIWDLSFWVFVFGILGARGFYVIQYWQRDFADDWVSALMIWKGGLVIYGGALGGLVAFFLFCRQQRIPRLWLLDLLAPSLALGMAIGRIGCLCNGCCYGDYSDLPWAVRFPAGSIPWQRMVEANHQSSLGVISSQTTHAVQEPELRDWLRAQTGMVPETVTVCRVSVLEPDTAAASILQPGDEILAVAELLVRDQFSLEELYLEANREHAKKTSAGTAWWRPLPVTFLRDGKLQTQVLTPAQSLPLHPSQIYSSIKGLMLFLFLSIFYRYRWANGQVIALFAIFYSVNRFLIEYLRYDELPFANGLTVSQNVSLIMFGVGLLLFAGVTLGWIRGANPIWSSTKNQTAAQATGATPTRM